MGDRPPTRLERLWRRDELDRSPRLGLSLERVVQSGVELADTDGLAAVSMKRVAERLGFTTMSLYRYVASKDELLLHMHDTVWRPPPGLDAPLDGWRSGLQRWAWEQHLIMQRHPWLDEVRLIDRAGTPSQIAWMDLGLRALTGAPLTEYLKVAVLLLLSGYVSSHARLASTADEGSGHGLLGGSDQASDTFGELLRTFVSADRFPALHAAVVGGAFARVEDPTYAPFELGLDLMLDGIDRQMDRRASASRTALAESE
jgi:AcrR family transcriptional regulator